MQMILLHLKEVPKMKHRICYSLCISCNDFYQKFHIKKYLYESLIRVIIHYTSDIEYITQKIGTNWNCFTDIELDFSKLFQIKFKVGCIPF